MTTEKKIVFSVGTILSALRPGPREPEDCRFLCAPALQPGPPDEVWPFTPLNRSDREDR